MMETLFLLWPVLSLLAGAVMLQLVGAITGGVTFETWGSAFAAVFISNLVSGAAWYAVLTVWSQSPWIVIYGVVPFIVNFASLAVAGSVLTGMHVKGVFGLFLAAVALTAINLGIAYWPLVTAASN